MLLNLVKTVSSSSILQLHYAVHRGLSKSLASSLRFFPKNMNISTSGINTRCQQTPHQSNRSLRLINHRNYSAEVKTNVANNVLLWKYDHSKYHRNLNIFSVIQFATFAVITYYCIDYLPSWKQDETLREFSKRAYLPISIVFCTAMAGIGATWLIWFYTVRSVKYIILLKGGKDVTLVTYHPIKGTTQKTVPVTHVSTTKYRTEKRMYLPLRIRNTSLYHLLDGDGVFINPELFDHTVGLARSEQRGK